MTDANNNGVPDAAEKAVERNAGKLLGGVGIAALLVTGVSVAVKWNELIQALAQPHIRSAVLQAELKKDVYLNARENQVTCLEGDKKNRECRELYERKVKNGLDRLKEGQ